MRSHLPRHTAGVVVGPASDRDLFTVAWAITDDADAAVAAVHAGAGSLAGVVLEAIGRARITEKLPAGLLDVDPIPLTESDEEPLIVAEAASAEGLATVARIAGEALAPADRAVLALTDRLGLDGADLAAALERSPGTVTADVQAARERAEHVVGSIVFAAIGRAACADLSAALDTLGTDPAAIDIAARVAEHVTTCALCADRRRGLVPAATLLAGVPVPPPPPSLRRAAALTTPAGPAPRSRAPRRRLAVIAIVAVAAGIAGGSAIAVATRPDHRPAAARGDLVASTTDVDLAANRLTAAVILQNGSGRAAPFRVSADVPWLSVTPATGELPPGGSTALTVNIDRTAAPEGANRGQLHVISPAGNSVVAVTATVEHAPVLGTLTVSPSSIAAAKCPGPNQAEVTVPVVEESGLTLVLLHWKTTTPRPEAAPMTTERTVAKGSLGPFAAGQVTWWVTATDTHGNTATSPQQTLTVTGC
jgi:hypothetical protein